MKNKDRKPNGYWTKERCFEKALTYSTIGEFRKSYDGAYTKARRKGWLKEICLHMILSQKPSGYWTKERCTKEASKYDTKKDFIKNNSSAYVISCKNRWIDDICFHMKILGSMVKRLIYAYEFSDNYVYIGLTYDLEKRDSRHKKDKKSKVYKHIEATGLTPVLKQRSELIDVERAKILEGEILMEYQALNWMILNKAKTGGIGGHLKWTRGKCIKEALKYKTKKEFRLKNQSAYNSAIKNKWLDDICSHMAELRSPNGYWTFENCQLEALKYKTKKEFRENNESAYQISGEKDWLDKICIHMSPLKKPEGLWKNFDNLKNELLPICQKLNHFPKRRELISIDRSDITSATKNYGGLLKVKEIFQKEFIYEYKS